MKNTDETATLLKILSNSKRFLILALLHSAKKDLCVHEISESIGSSQSLTSHQLAYLEACGVVESIRTGRTKCYIPTQTHLSQKLKRVLRTLE